MFLRATALRAAPAVRAAPPLLAAPVLAGRRCLATETLTENMFTARGRSDSGDRVGRVMVTSLAPAEADRKRHGNLVVKMKKGKAGIFGGDAAGKMSSPEELLAMAHAASFNDALRQMARRHGYKFGASTVETSVSLGVVSKEEGVRGLQIEVLADVQKTDDATAQELAELAHELCPISRALGSTFDVKIIGVGEFEHATRETEIGEDFS